MNKMDENKLNPEKRSFLSFVVADELFALDVHHVIKIIEVEKFTRVPQSPEYFRGVANFGGGVLPVIDTYLKFGFPKKENNADTLVLVLNIQVAGKDMESRLGMTIGEAREVFEVDIDQVKEYPATGNKYKSEYISGVVERGGQFILLLDGDKLFSDDELGGIINTNESN